MPDYHLTPEADDDLIEIARYTLKTWGEEQAEHYENKLRSVFEAIACGKAHSREVKKHRPELRVSRCEHHYIFYRLRKNQVTLAEGQHP